MTLQHVLAKKLKWLRESDVEISYDSEGKYVIKVTAAWPPRFSAADREQAVYEALSAVTDEATLCRVNKITCLRA